MTYEIAFKHLELWDYITNKIYKYSVIQSFLPKFIFNIITFFIPLSSLSDLKRKYFKKNKIFKIPRNGCYLCDAYQCSECPLAIFANETDCDGLCVSVYQKCSLFIEKHDYINALKCAYKIRDIYG